MYVFDAEVSDTVAKIGKVDGKTDLICTTIHFDEGPGVAYFLEMVCIDVLALRSMYISP